MLTEGGRGSDQRICALYGELCGEPRPPQHPRFGPRRGCEIVLGAQVFSQRGEQGIPALITNSLRLGLHEADLDVGWFPAVFLEELPHELPPHPLVDSCSQVVGEGRQAHRLVSVHRAHLSARLRPYAMQPLPTSGYGKRLVDHHRSDHTASSDHERRPSTSEAPPRTAEVGGWAGRAADGGLILAFVGVDAEDGHGLTSDENELGHGQRCA